MVNIHSRHSNATVTDACSPESLIPLFFTKLRKKSETATFKLNRARKAADAASNAPTGSRLSSQTLELGEKANVLSIAADRAAAALAKFPNPQLAATNAAHIFPESTNTNFSNDVKVRKYVLKL
jgi:hypothetical protein